MMRRCALTMAGLVALATPAWTQSVLERSPNLTGGWVGLPGYFYSTLPHRFEDGEEDEGLDVQGAATFELSFGLPHRLLLGVKAAPESRAVPGETDEAEVLARWAPWLEDAGAPVHLAVDGGFNTAASSFDGALSLARWLGPLRLLAEGRAMTSAFGAEDTRFALAGGGVLHVRPGGIPVGLAADVGTMVDRERGEKVAWSAGVQLGLSFSRNTLSLQASNAMTTTIQGRSRGSGKTRWGFELTVPVRTFGELLGFFAPREVAERAVVVEPADAPAGEVFRVEVSRYEFRPGRLVVPAGATVEWVNYDDVVHTVNAEDGTFHSGAIRKGERWRARFDEPGTYAYYCGPHPFMQGVVVVR